jgi:hypothetical protein
MRHLFWHPIFGRLYAWFGLGTHTSPAALFLGVTDAGPVFLGQADGAFPFGIINAGGLNLGSIEAGPVRLGLVPVRRGS